MIGVRKISKVVLAALLVLFVAATNATVEPERYPGTVLTNLSNPNFSTAIDGKYIAMSNPNWESQFFNMGVKGYVIFGIDPTSLQGQITSTGNITIDVEITADYYMGNNTFNQGQPQMIQLTINYDPDNLTTAKAFFEVPNAHQLTAKVINISGGVSILTAQPYLTTEIVVDRRYIFTRNYFPSQAAGFNIQHSISTTNRIIVDWTDITNAEEYDLEWAHFSSYDEYKNEIPAASFNLPEDPFKNASRVTTKKSDYELPLVFDKGYLLFRVRGKGRVPQDGFAKLYEGNWSSDPKIPYSTISAFTDFEPISSGHEADMNWNYQAVFTESGKNKYSMTYSDGSGRSRQTVINQNDIEESIVSETFYDFQGRPAIEALPAPTGTINMQFYQNFNTYNGTNPYNKTKFDIDAGDCTSSTEKFSTSNSPSAGNYYSPNNSNTGLTEDMYVPDAGGYPFVQTLYTSDKTGRVRAKTIPGDGFKAGSNKESKFIYATPYQEELDALFGSDVGLAHKYKKNVVIDANGQASITFINPNDKTIATAISGEGPTTVDELISYQNSGGQYDVDLLGKVVSSDRVGQLEKIDYTKGIRELSRVIPVVKKAAQNFTYQIDAEEYQHECELNAAANKCFDCVLEVEVSLVNDCGEEFLTGIDGNNGSSKALGVSAGLSRNCGTSMVVADYGPIIWNTNTATNDPKQLEVGAYNLRKTLKIDFDKLQKYADDYIETNTCLKTEGDFRLIEEAKLGELFDCNVTCAQCKSELGASFDASPFNENKPDCDPCINQELYNQLIAECDKNCEEEDQCEIKLQNLLADMSPGGQYGLTSEGGELNIDEKISDYDNTIEPWKFPLSVFNDRNRLPLRRLKDVSNTTKALIPNWRNPIKINRDGILQNASAIHYLNYDGSPYKVYLSVQADGSYVPEINGAAITDVDNGQLFVYPENLKNVVDFIRIWQPQWAEQLVAYHPEFGYYQYCVLMNLSNDYDKQLFDGDDFSGTETPESEDDLDVEIRDIVSGSASTVSNDYKDLLDKDPFFNFEQNPYKENASEIEELRAAFKSKLMSYGSKNGTTLSAWQMAWLMAEENCSNPSSTCGSCEPPEEPVIDDLIWKHFRSLYLSAKQEIMRQHVTEKVINSDHPNNPGKILPSYNECIGNNRFNKFKNGFYLAPIVTWPITGSYFWLSNFTAYITAYNNALAASYGSQYYNAGQSCNRFAYWLYRTKDPRFGDGFTGSDLNALALEACDNANKYSADGCTFKTEQLLTEMKKEAQVQRFIQCGQCPLAFDLESLLNGVIKKGKEDPSYGLTQSFELPCNIPELTDDLNAALESGGISTNTPNPNLFWENIGTLDQLQIVMGTCTLNFPEITSTLGISYDQIDEICCLGPSGNVGDFSFTIFYESPDDGAILEAELTANSCLDLLNCDFGDKCILTDVGFEIQDLFNSLNSKTTSGQTRADFFGAGTNIVDIDDDYYEGAIGALIQDFLRAKTKADATLNLKWDVTSISNNEIVGRVYTNNTNDDCEFRLTAPASLDLQTASLDYFYDIRPDESVNNPYQFLMRVRDASGVTYELVGTSCIEVAECKPYLDQHFFTSNNRVDTRPCETNSIYDQISTQLKAIPNLGSSLRGNTYWPLTYLDEQQINQPCTLSLRIENSLQTIPLGFLKEVLETYIAKGEDNTNRMFAFVKVCEGLPNLLCDGSTAIVEVLTDCGPLFDCEKIPTKKNDDCEYYNIVDDIRKNFDAYYAANLSSLVDEGGGRYLLDDLIPGCNVYMNEGVKFNNHTQQQYLQLEKEAVKPIDDLFDPPHAVIANMRDLYVVKEPNVNGYLLNAYIVCEILNGDLVSFKLETDESCPFGRCGECLTENLVENGDFEFEDESIYNFGTPHILPQFHSSGSIKTATSGTVISRNYLPIGGIVGSIPGNQTFVNYGVVTYNNYYKFFNTNPNLTPFRPLNLNPICPTTAPSYLGTHSSISTAATESMTGNFLALKIADFNTLDNYVVWEQGVILPGNNVDDKNYEFAMDAMRFFENFGTSSLACKLRFEVIIDGVVYTFVNEADNLYDEWISYKTNMYTCVSQPVFNHTVNDRWEIDWENIKIPFVSEKDNILIQIRIIKKEVNSNIGTCSIGEGYFMGFDNITLREKPCNNSKFPSFCHAKPSPQYPLEDFIVPCDTLKQQTARYNARTLYQQYIDSVEQSFKEGYIQKCLNSNESFTMNYTEGEHHYTLYYYDQAGNLVRTIPPKGVNKLTQTEAAKAREDRRNGIKTVFTEHTMATTYAYNSLGQLLQQNVPDHDDLDIFSIEFISSTGSPGLPSDFYAEDIVFTNKQHGVAVGHQYPLANNKGMVYVTNDGGKTWQQANSTGTENYNYIDQSKYIVGDKGRFLIYESSSGEWKKRDVPTNENLIYIVVGHSPGEIFVFSENGKRFASYDDGTTWAAPTNFLGSLANGKITAVKIDVNGYNTEGIAVSNQGELFYTSDFGLSWSRRQVIQATDLSTVSYLNGRYIYSGSEGYLYESGVSSLSNLTSDLLGNVKELYAEDKDNWHAVYQDPTLNSWRLASSSDGGKTWPNIVSYSADVKDIFLSGSDEYFLTETELRSISSNWNTGGAVVKTGSNFNAYYKEGSNQYIGKSNGKIEYKLGTGTWITSPTITSGSIKELVVDQVNATGVILTENNQLWKTTVAPPPSAAAWAWTQLVPADQFVDIHFVSATHGYALTDDGKVIATTDGGNSWPTVLLDLQDANAPFKTMHFESTTGKGTIAGDNGNVWITSDGGLTWTDLTGATNLQTLNGLGYDGSNANLIFAVGENGTLIKSTDGGIVWSMLEAQTKKDLFDVSIIGNVGIIGGAGIIGGISAGTVSQIDNHGSKQFKEVHYKQATSSKALHSNGVYSGQIGSFTAAPIATTSETINSLQFSGIDLVTVGNNGEIFSSTAGAAWVKENTYVPPVQQVVFALNNNIHYTGGNQGYLAKSVNGGSTWQLLDNPATSITSGKITGVYFKDEGHGIIVTDNGDAFKYDENATPKWDVLTSTSGTIANGASNPMRDLHMLNQNTGIMLGKNKLYYTDGGIHATWLEMNFSPSVSGLDLEKVFMVDNDRGYASDRNQKFFKIERTTGNIVATEVATSYVPLGGSGFTHFEDIFFIDRLRGYGVGGDELFVTTDGGANWEAKTNISGQNRSLITALAFTQLGEGIYIGQEGAVGSITDFAEYFSDRFYYDRLGRLVVSQNSKQYGMSSDVYSYTLYDAIGRIAQVGEINAAKAIEENYVKGLLDQDLFDDWFTNGSKSQITRTYYDNPIECAVFATLNLQQDNLRSRVSSSTYDETDADEDPCTYTHATHYSYDVHGNVKTLYQEYPELTHLSQQVKTIEYEYDLISGNVKQVNYQKGAVDQFFHQYKYDGDNRLIEVLTSTNGWNWTEEAAYEYYRHGPLKRTELGDWDVQGVDYAYTIQGWMKGANSNTMKPNRDIGRDGSASGNGHENVAIDAVGFNLGYYKGDYSPVGSPSENFEASITGSYLDDPINGIQELYNGNIAYMTTAFTDNVTDGTGPQAMIYQYDQLNRIKGATSYTRMDQATNSWALAAPLDNRYNTTYSFDANGNLKTLTRQDDAGGNMDSFTYRYHHTEDQATTGSDWGGKNTNRLLAVEDGVSNEATADDLKSGQSYQDWSIARNNYAYDPIGNLTKDSTENIENIEWTVSGKIKRIERESVAGVGQADFEFFYDAQGNRVRKIMKPRNTADGQLLGEDQWIETVYVRDAQGNTLATYEKNYSTEETNPGEYHETLRQTEVNLFGSDRLGTYHREQEVAEVVFSDPLTNGLFGPKVLSASASPLQNDNIVEFKGKKRYELKNHLGNVLAVITDNKKPKINSSSTTNTTTSTVFTEDFKNDGQWMSFNVEEPSETGEVDISFEDETMVVSIFSEGHGIRRFIDVENDNNCDYEYCLTFEEGFPREVIFFETFDAQGNPIGSEPIEDSPFCVAIDVDHVKEFRLFLADFSNGNEIRMTSAEMKKTCTETITSSSFAYYEPIVKNRTDYYPFGMLMPNRGGSLIQEAGHRYGFNSMERDDEVSGSGNSYDFGARMYNPRLGRWFSTDPLAKKQPGWSPYKSFLDNPILYVDPDGETEYITIITENKKTGETSIEFTKADRVMTDGKLHAINLMGKDIAAFNNHYYDYATTTLRTVGTDGAVTESTRTDILYSNGVKDKDLMVIGGNDYGDTKRETWEFFGAHNDGGLLVFGSGADNQGSIGPKVRMPWGNFDFAEFSSIMGKVNTAMKSKKDYNLNKKFEFPGIKATSLLSKAKSLVEYSNEHRDNWVTCPTCSQTDSSHIDELHGSGTFDSLKTEAKEGQ